MDFKPIFLLVIRFGSTAQVRQIIQTRYDSLTLVGRGALIEASSAIQQQKALSQTRTIELLYTHILIEKYVKGVQIVMRTRFEP